MTRILLVTNKHPNEAFGISVARETAKELRTKGHEVIFKKIPFKETALGSVVHAKKRLGEAEKSSRDKASFREEDYIKQVKADLTYNFHCTPRKNTVFWKKRGNSDFWISGGKRLDGTRQYIVKIKAEYQPFPKGLRRKIRENTQPGVVKNSGNYLRRTTSFEKTVKQGLTPTKFAKAIANTIVRKNLGDTSKYSRHRGRITKAKPARRKRI